MRLAARASGFARQQAKATGSTGGTDGNNLSNALVSVNLGWNVCANDAQCGHCPKHIVRWELTHKQLLLSARTRCAIGNCMPKLNQPLVSVCARRMSTLRCSQQFAYFQNVSQTRRSKSNNIELSEFSLLFFTVVCMIFKVQLDKTAFTQLEHQQQQRLLQTGKL